MPYKSIKDLPQSIRKNLPTEAQKLFRAVINDALERYNDEATAFKVAWQVVGTKYKKGKNDQWVKIAGIDFVRAEDQTDNTINYTFRNSKDKNNLLASYVIGKILSEEDYFKLNESYNEFIEIFGEKTKDEIIQLSLMDVGLSEEEIMSIELKDMEKEIVTKAGTTEIESEIEDFTPANIGPTGVFKVIDGNKYYQQCYAFSDSKNSEDWIGFHHMPNIDKPHDVLPVMNQALRNVMYGLSGEFYSDTTIPPVYPSVEAKDNAKLHVRYHYLNDLGYNCYDLPTILMTDEDKKKADYRRKIQYGFSEEYFNSGKIDLELAEKIKQYPNAGLSDTDLIGLSDNLVALGFSEEKGNLKKLADNIYEKEVLLKGKFLNPNYPARSSQKFFTVDDKALNNILTNFSAKTLDNVPIVWNHSLDARDVNGDTIGLKKTERGLSAILVLDDENAIKQADKNRLGVSVLFDPEYTDKKTGQKKGDTLVHIGLVQGGWIKGMQPFQKIQNIELSDKKRVYLNEINNKNIQCYFYESENDKVNYKLEDTNIIKIENLEDLDNLNDVGVKPADLPEVIKTSDNNIIKEGNNNMTDLKTPDKPTKEQLTKSLKDDFNFDVVGLSEQVEQMTTLIKLSEGEGIIDGIKRIVSDNEKLSGEVTKLSAEKTTLEEKVVKLSDGVEVLMQDKKKNEAEKVVGIALSEHKIQPSQAQFFTNLYVKSKEDYEDYMKTVAAPVIPLGEVGMTVEVKTTPPIVSEGTPVKTPEEDGEIKRLTETYDNIIQG